MTKAASRQKNDIFTDIRAMLYDNAIAYVGRTQDVCAWLNDCLTADIDWTVAQIGAG